MIHHHHKTLIVTILVNITISTVISIEANPKSIIRIIQSRGQPQQFGSVHITVHNDNPTSLLTTLAEEEAVILGLKLKEFAENYRNNMSTSNVIMPSLDPLHINSLPQLYRKYLGAFSFTLNIWDINIGGLSKFILEGLQIRLNTRRVDLQLAVPELMIEAQYALRVGGQLDILTYKPRGMINVVCKDVQLNGNIVADLETPPEEKSRFVIEGYNIGIDVKHVEISTTGLVSNRHANQILNTFVKGLSDVTLDIVVQKSADFFAELILDHINQYLTNVSAADIIAWYISTLT